MTTYTSYVNDISHSFVTCYIGRLRPMSCMPKNENYNVMDIHCSELDTFALI
jgi:hypothetical protein